MTGFLALLQSPLCTDDDVEKIFNLFEQHINTIEDQEVKIKAQRILTYIKDIQIREQEFKEQDGKDIEKLLASLDQI